MKKKNNKKPRDQIQVKKVKEGKELKKKYKGLIPLTKDICFKMFFERNDNLLLELLNIFLPLPKGRRAESLEIIKSESLPDFADDKLVIFDINVRLNTGERVIVEMQNVCSIEQFRKRFLYYQSRLYTKDFKEGQGYETLRNTYILIFLTTGLLENTEEFYSSVSQRFDKYPYEQFSDAQSLIIVELDKMTKGSVEELVDLKEEMCYFLKRSEELTGKELNQLSQRSTYMKNAVKTLEDLSQDEKMRHAMEQRQKNIAEYNARMMEAENKGRSEGMEKGRSEGIEKGRSEGIEKGMEKVALNMLKANLDADLISEVTGLSKEEIQKLSK